jgi:hypothetical protein
MFIKMAKRKTKVEEVEVVETIVETPKKPNADVTYYSLKKRLKVSGKWKEIGEKIGLTKDAYRDFKFKKIV